MIFTFADFHLYAVSHYSTKPNENYSIVKLPNKFCSSQFSTVEKEANPHYPSLTQMYEIIVFYN